MYKISICFLLLISNIVYPQDTIKPISITDTQKRFEIVGELGVKLGATVTVEGKIIEGPYKGYEGGPNLLIQTINDFSNQKLIEIPIRPYWGNFGEGSLPEIKTGKTYRFRVYETGKYVGIPHEAYKEANVLIQTSGFYFKNELVVISGEIIEGISINPSDFLDREALILGVAKNINNIPHIIGQNWKLELIGGQKWKKDDLGKQVEVYGLVKKSENKISYYVENTEPRFRHLEDMLNDTVKLRGQARSTNGQWWFHYRGTDLFVENMNQMPGWTTSNHFRPIEISGILKSIDAKDVDKGEIESHLYCNGDYVIVNPSWIPIDRLLIPEIEEMSD
ncbi:MAG: hypothetical protein HRT68_09820 [Flavobacteriaceae bacterium]|nr:hypothetical protein [Flavobacteriaceae bacterium]